MKIKEEWIRGDITSFAWFRRNEDMPSLLHYKNGKLTAIYWTDIYGHTSVSLRGKDIHKVKHFFESYHTCT